MMKAKRDVNSPGWADPPDDAPADLWPDISKLPTRHSVAVIAKARRARPDDYLAVVNGLRWATTGDMSSAFSMLTAWLAVLAIVFAALAPLTLWALLGALVFFAAFTVMLNRIAGIVDGHTDRKRHATVWLAALEDADAAARRRWPW